MKSDIKILLLNGVGSVGKSSIAKELQSILVEPYLHVGVDHFIDMMPIKYLNAPEGIHFESTELMGYPIVKITTGTVGDKVMRGMRHAMAALAEQGNNLIIDEVLIDDVSLKEYSELLAAFKVFYIGIFAPLEVVEEREHKRGDRLIGLARWQYDLVHRDKSYDLEIDTASMSPLECAEFIKTQLCLI